MKPLLDAAQNLLTYPGEFGLLLRFFAVLLLCLLVRVAWFNLKKIRSLWPKFGVKSVAVWCLIAVVVSVFADQLADWLQTFEPPVYESTFKDADEETKCAAFERVLNKYVTPEDFKLIQRATRETAYTLHCKPSDIYAVALSECGLNPYRVRADKIAAGWIQFTQVGMGYVPGVKYEQVLNACWSQDADKIMDWTRTYLLNTQKGRQITGPGDLYLCVFAPEIKVQDEKTVLFSGANNPAYYLNAGIDGWIKDGERISRKRTAIDYKITVGELRLMVEYKAAKILEQ